MSGWGHRTRQRWERCYRRGGHKGVSIIRRDRDGVSGWGHRTRWWWGRCYRRGATRGRALFTNSCDEADSDRGYKPMCARWSTAAIAAAVTASTICCREGGKSAPGASSMPEFATRGGRRCVCSRCLDIRGGNGGASLSLCSAA